MGNNSLLDAKKHIVELIVSVNDISNAEQVEHLARALEIIVGCEHTSVTLDSLARLKPDFPTEIDFD